MTGKWDGEEGRKIDGRKIFLSGVGMPKRIVPARETFKDDGVADKYESDLQNKPALF